jgi:predicted AAA+ superfamily ATPase
LLIFRNNSIAIAFTEFIRKINLLELLGKKSLFLFGPRSTGKTYLIRKQLADQALLIDLLKSNLYLTLSANPSELEAIIDAEPKDRAFVVLDEIQRIPALLNEVHRLMESRKLRFLLTGSSARQLKRKDANLLGGRAWRAELFPLSWSEIPHFKLDHYLRFGGLPHVYPSKNPGEELDAYVNVYLKEEIQAEGLIRKLPPFSRFLKTAALSNGHVLNFTEVANDSQVPPSTVREYYSILTDTLMGFMLEPWLASIKRKAIQTAKFYFFDPGVMHTLAGTRSLERNSDLYGVSFEQFIGMELRAYLSYRRIKETLTFWRTTHGFEVDYLIGDRAAIEVTATSRVAAKHLKGLKALAEEKLVKKMFLVSHDPIATKKEGIHAMPWERFLQDLWSGKIV